VRAPLILLLVACPGLALAHVTQPPDGMALIAGDAVPNVALETTIGLLVSTDDSLRADSFRWVCHEALSSSDALRIPRYVARPDGSLLATIESLDLGFVPNESVYRTTDACSWDAVTGLTGRVVSQLSVDPEGRVLAASANLAAGADNGVFVSEDGQSFAPTSLTANDRFFVSVHQGPRTWVGAASVAPEGAWVHVADDVHGVWTEWAMPGDSAEHPRILTTDPADPDRAWVRMDGFERDRLLVTEDGGATWDSLWEGDSDVLHATLGPDDTLWVTLSLGELLSGPGAGPLAQVDAPASRATHFVDGQHLVVSDYLVEGWVLGDLGGDLDAGLFSFRDLAGRLECPADTRTEQECAPLYETVERLLGIYENDDPPPPPDLPSQGGCDCADEGASAAWLLGAPLLLRRRYRLNR